MLLGQTFFLAAVVLTGSLASAGCALLYFQNVRLERPAIGVFNFRDIGILFFFILTLPVLYLVLPSVGLIAFLILTFIAALYICLRPLLRPRVMWPLILGLLAVNIVVDQTLLGLQIGWQIYWILTSIAVLLAAVGVSNLYIQGGMRLRHVAWFALALAFYDGFFALVIPLSQHLADHFEGLPLDPSIGFKMGAYNANIGLGDLLVYCLFTVAAYKGFGRTGAIASFVIITIFGALVPAFSPLVIAAVVRTGIGIVVPAQLSFGPAAFITYFWLARRAPERSMAEWFSAQATTHRANIRLARRPRPVAGLSLANASDAHTGEGSISE